MAEKEKSMFEPLSKQEQVDIISKILTKYDVKGLTTHQEASLDENKYLCEAQLIENEISHKRNLFGFYSIIRRVFENRFHEPIDMKKCKQIGLEMIAQLERHQDFCNFSENEHLRGKVQINDFEYRLTVHPGFIVTSSRGNTYINGKFYFDIEDQDLLQEYIDFACRNQRIFVQYKHRHLLFNHVWERPLGYFKEIKKKKFDWFRLKYRDDIESIFDNQQIIYSPSLDDDYIINMMHHQPIQRDHEKVLFSPNRMKRLIIYRNEEGSYSYLVEKMTINDSQERVVYGCLAFWEQIDITASFYESLDNLLKDLQAEFKDWESAPE